jgi:hypothetical protein
MRRRVYSNGGPERKVPFKYCPPCRYHFWRVSWSANARTITSPAAEIRQVVWGQISLKLRSFTVTY